MKFETRLRKCAAVVRKFERDLAEEKKPDTFSLRNALQVLREWRNLEEIEDLIQEIGFAAPPAPAEKLRRKLNTLWMQLLRELGEEPAEWDLFCPGQSTADSHSRILPLSVFLEEIRSPFNVGAIFRTAECFGFQKIYLSPNTPTPSHPRTRRSAMGTEKMVPWERKELTELTEAPFCRPVFLLETGGTDISDFTFPPKGMVILGNEEFGASAQARTISQKGDGMVSIPMTGRKRSLNIAVAFGITAYAWSASIRNV